MYIRILATHLRPRFARNFPPSSKSEGAGNAGCALHPRSHAQVWVESARMSIQGSGEHPASPAQGKINSPMKFCGALWTPQPIDHPNNIPITCHTPS